MINVDMKLEVPLRKGEVDALQNACAIIDNIILISTENNFIFNYSI